MQLNTTLVICLTILLSACGSRTDNTTSKSNIIQSKMNVLYIMTDDHAAHAVGTYGGRLSKLNPTPNIDEFAKQGMTFTNVFVTNSICVPSRATILTGQYSQTNGALSLVEAIAEDQQHLPRLMGEAGYETAIIGKWHLKAEPAAFDHYQVLEQQGRYFDPIFRTRGKHNWPENEVEIKGHSSDVVTDLSIKWLNERNTAKPFFLMHQFKAPHDYFKYAPRYEDYLAAEFIPEPDDLYAVKQTFGSVATRGENDSLRNDIGTSVSRRHNRRQMGIDLGVDPALPEKEFTRKSYQKYLKAYLRCVKGVDDNFARLIQALKDNGEYNSTIIIYTSDQGMMLGEHDFQDKRWMYEESIKMPFLIRDPRMSESDKQNNMIINNTDFAPLILDLVGIDVPTFMHGRSFASALNGIQPKNWRTASYYRYWTHRAYHDVPAHLGVRSKDYKLIFYYGANYKTEPRPFYDRKWVARTGLNNNAINTPAAWELYDLRNDPSEQNNVYSDARYAQVVDDLKAEMKRQRAQYNETDVNYPHLQKIIDTHW